jgi:hypothetical protein
VLELFAGVGATTQAQARVGYMIGEVVACELRGAAMHIHRHALTQLAREFPTRVSAKAGAQLHHRISQDIQLVTADHLQALGPIDLVVAGWPYQGSSAARTGQGLDDSRSKLLVELLRVLHVLQGLHNAWGRPLGYLIEHVAAGHNKRPKVQQDFAAARGLLGPELVVDAARLGSRAHRLRAWWTNLEGVSLLRAAFSNQQRPPGLFVHQVLGRGRRAKRPQGTGMAPWTKAEVPGQERRTLNTFVSYSGSYAFSRNGGAVLRVQHPDGGVTFEKPTTEERKLAIWVRREGKWAVVRSGDSQDKWRRCIPLFWLSGWGRGRAAGGGAAGTMGPGGSAGGASGGS